MRFSHVSTFLLFGNLVTQWEYTQPFITICHHSSLCRFFNHPPFGYKLMIWPGAHTKIRGKMVKWQVIFSTEMNEALPGNNESYEMSERDLFIKLAVHLTYMDAFQYLSLPHTTPLLSLSLSLHVSLSHIFSSLSPIDFSSPLAKFSPYFLVCIFLSFCFSHVFIFSHFYASMQYLSINSGEVDT